MKNAYITALRATGAHPDHFIAREQRRYELAASLLREAGFHGSAGMFDGFAEQAALEIEALARVDQRIAELDAKLNGEIAA